MLKPIKLILLVSLFSLVFASQITIQKYNNVVIAYSDKYKHTIVLPNKQSRSTEFSMKDSNFKEIVEEDLPVELHSFNTLAVNDNKNVVNIKSVISNDPILVAVIDTGLDLSNTDLKPYIYENTKETLNGIDDDNNGYVDDNNGYNFFDDKHSHQFYSN